MGIVSYAQNFEDVMLWRALGHVEHGCYIDIGAQHPIVDSVSKAFYLHGWRGIHVEPTVFYADLMRRDRPEETVIQAAIAGEEGLLHFFEIPDTGLSTASPKIAADHRQSGYAVREIIVTTLTMDTLLGSVESPEVHWLKIDVEGFEMQVLSGWHSSICRPWIVVIESTAPNSQTETHEAWEPMVVGKGYELAYIDGLNRYYVSSDHQELKRAFRFGPCIFDDFEMSESAWSFKSVRRHYEERLADVTHQRREQEERAQALHEDLMALRETHDGLRQRMEESERQFEAALEAQREARLASEVRAAGLDLQAEAARDREALLRKDFIRQSEQAALIAAQLVQMQRTISWQLTSPLRSLGRFLRVDRQRFDNHSAVATIVVKYPSNGRLPSFGAQQNFSAVLPVVFVDLEQHLSHQMSKMLPIQHVDQLLELNGPRFLSVAYQTLLGRSPDPEGTSYYLGLLRAGNGKASVIAQLGQSKEAKSRVPEIQLSGLDRLIARQKKARHWLLRFFFRAGRTERKFNQLEYELGCATGRLIRLEAKIAATHGGAVDEGEIGENESRVDPLLLTPRAQQILARFTQGEARSLEEGVV